ncbi:MAG: hypothetical protein ACRCZK_03390 [Oscillospiraceae bacterium]
MITIKLQQALKTEFQSACNYRKANASSVIRHFMINYINDTADIFQKRNEN